MHNEKSYWYVLFCQTGAEERLAGKLEGKLGSGTFPFIPKKTCVFRRQGESSSFQKICFPGYLFIESKHPAIVFWERVFPVVYQHKEAYRFLSYGDSTDIAMLDEEQGALSEMLDDEYRISITSGFEEGESIRITSGALMGVERKIVRVDKKKHEAVITFQMFNALVTLSVGLDIVEKTTD